MQQQIAPAATDRLAPSRPAIRPAARPRPPPDAENFGGEVSFRSFPLGSLYSITSSASASSRSGTASPSALAVLRLITNSNLVDCSTGRSAGFVPRRILSAYSAAHRYMLEKFTP